MKTHKRNMVDRAFNKGYKAGMRGRSTDGCPYVTVAVERGSWMAGWRDGRNGFLSGYLDIESV